MSQPRTYSTKSNKIKQKRYFKPNISGCNAINHYEEDISSIINSSDNEEPWAHNQSEKSIGNRGTYQ